MIRFLTAGESHGPALIGILEGLPAGLRVDAELIRKELFRRKQGYGRGDRQKIETEEVEILSGVRFGRTIGSPVTLLIRNKDFENWKSVMQVEPGAPNREREVVVPRPGHADLAGAEKYGFDDMRNVLERASARETTMRVALGALARQCLEELSIRISSRVVSIGPIKDESSPQTQAEYEPAEHSDLRVLDHQVEKEMKRWIDHARHEGDTLGGVFEVVAWNLPVGLGSYVQWDRKLDGDLGQAFLSLNAIKGVEIGLGFESSKKTGREAHDEYVPGKSRIEAVSNRSGGISGGVSNGQPLIVRAAMKPLATLKTPLSSVDVRSGQATQAHFERSDVCAVPSASVIGESLVALVLLDRILEKFGGDSMGELGARVIAWRKHLGF